MLFRAAIPGACDETYMVVPQVYRNRGGSLIMMKPSRFLTELAPALTDPTEHKETLPHLLGGAELECLPPAAES